MTLTEKLARIQLSIAGNVSPLKFVKILESYSSATSYLKSVSESSLKLFPDYDQNRALNRYEIDIRKTLVYGEDRYPELLTQIADPPIALKFSGDINLLNSPKIISMVGTRNNTEYGRNCTVKLASELSKEGFTIVSGMAIGIDTIVHKTVLGEGGKTIAVLPGDLSSPYPKRNMRLFEEISSRGLVISELSRDNDMQKYAFVKRNRIIAGLSKACVVTEAPQKSGALITAELALNYNREVYAVPSSVFSLQGVGCNNLIAEGKARLLSSKDELLSDLRIEKSVKLEGLSGEEQIVVTNLRDGAASFDTILKSAKIASPDLYRVLLGMEFKQLIAKSLNGNYTLLI